jgi:hypothetical protein
MAKAIQSTGNVGEHPTTCDHCGGPTEEIGLVAPKCTVCGKFSLSHISWSAPEEIDVDIRVE